MAKKVTAIKTMTKAKSGTESAEYDNIILEEYVPNNANFTLSSSNWTEVEGSSPKYYEQTISLSWMTKNTEGIFGLQNDVELDVSKMAARGQLRVSSQSDGSITFRYYGSELPSADIPCHLTGCYKPLSERT